MKPGPYDELDPMWFWSRHKEFIKPYKKRSIKPEKQIYLEEIVQIEKGLLIEEKTIVNQASSLTENKYLSKYIDLNKKAWKLTEQQIE